MFLRFFEKFKHRIADDDDDGDDDQCAGAGEAGGENDGVDRGDHVDDADGDAADSVGEVSMKKIDNGGSATAGGEEVHPHYPFFKGVLFSTSLNIIIDHVIDYHAKKLHAALTARLAAG